MSHLTEVFQRIEKCRVIPVIEIGSVESAIPLADALLEGGLPLAEITFRTKAAADVIARIKSERPEVLLGAGTVLTVENLQRAKECGAAFGVAPGTNPAVVTRAGEMGLPFIPGVATPSEVEQAMSLGCRVLKLFPAGVIGGVSMVKALCAPYGHVGVRFMPTGGVKTENLEAYLSEKSVIAVGGTWIATRDDIAQGRWKEISRRCREALKATAHLRG